MEELRVYTNADGAGRREEHPAFYSRRSDGPFYRRSYESKRRAAGASHA